MRIPSLSPARVLLLLPVLLFAGWKTYGHLQHRHLSPFALWDFRAGMAFEEIEAAALDQAKQRFTCHVAVADSRLCELHVTGIAGRMRVLVDARGRAAIVQFLPDSASPLMREEGRKIAASWSLVRTGAADPVSSPEASAATTRWTSEDGKWSTMMRYARSASTPALVHLADEMAVRATLKSAPLASLVLNLNDMIDSRQAEPLRDFSSALASTMFGRVTDPASASPAPGPVAASLPSCVAAPDLIMPGTGVVEQAIGKSMAALLELAVPAAYPGSRAVLADGLYIVDADGRSERVQISGSDLNSADGIGVFALYFPGRINMATARLEEGRPERFCRAPAEVLFARRAEDGSLAEAHRIVVDHDAIASDILRLNFADADLSGDPPHIRVRHVGLYGTDSWSGSVEWETVIAGDPPLPTGRVPLMFTRALRDKSKTTDGAFVVTDRPAGGLELSTLEQHKWGFSTRTVVAPVDSTGVLRGVPMLDRLP